MKHPFRTLTSRMVVLAVVQMLLLSIAAVVVFLLTKPDFPRPPAGMEPRPPVPRSVRLGPLITMACGFVVLSGGAILMARWIVRPLQRLSRTARVIGGGDLSVRSALTRTDEIGDLGRHLDDMAAQLEQLIASERELLANVAHELRTPLARIGVALDIAAEGDSDRARSSLAEIAADVAELDTIVDDLLTAMRFEARRGSPLPLRRLPIPPSAIAHAAVARLRARHPDRPLDVSIAADLPDIDADPALLRRALDNLLENADKYSPDRATPLVLVVAATDDARVRFEVRDSGIGISPQDLPRVYTAFFRSERSRSRQTGGVGLGLTLAKRIVEAHGGTIEIESEPGRGTRAAILIPAIAGDVELISRTSA